MSTKGFTLIETMVAVTILTLAVAGPLVTANRALVAARTAHDQLIASYLAQEGVEYVRAVRDNAFLAPYPGNTDAAWPDFLAATVQCDATGNPTRACTLDPESGLSISSCTIGSCGPLFLRSDGMYNQQGSGEQTIFARAIQRFYVSDTEQKVVSTVTWSFHGTPYTVSSTVHLTPWQ